MRYAELHQRNVEFGDSINGAAGQLIGNIEHWVRLSTLHACMSFFAALLTIYVAQVMTFDAGFGNKIAVYRFVQRVGLYLLAMALMVNSATPFIIPDAPWLTDVFVVGALVIVLGVSGIMHSRRRARNDAGTLVE